VLNLHLLKKFYVCKDFIVITHRKLEVTVESRIFLGNNNSNKFKSPDNIAFLMVRIQEVRQLPVLCET